MLLTPMLLTSFNAAIADDNLDYIDFINDTFYLTFSKSDFLGDYAEQYVATLNGSYHLNDRWRVFGSIDTDVYADIGIGYSFSLSEQLFNELSLSVGGKNEAVVTSTTGLFSAFKYNNFLVFSNFELQYIDYAKETYQRPIVEEITLDTYTLALNKLVGVSYDVNDYLSILTSYGHDKTHLAHTEIHAREYSHINKRDFYQSYINAGVVFNLWGVKPMFSHRFNIQDSSLNYWDFNLSFDF